MALKCPRCGQRLEVVKVTRPLLTFRQRQLLHAIEEGERDLGHSVPTTYLVALIGFSRATIKNELAHLEHMEQIHRPDGNKSGWAIRREDNIALVLAHSA